MRRDGLLFPVLLVLCLALPTNAIAADEAKGYAEWHRGGELIVDGQRIRAHAGTRFDADGVRSLESIPLGWEVEAKGRRQADGTILADEIEAKPNGSAFMEPDVLEASDEIEDVWLREGRMFEPTEEGGSETIGRIVDGDRRAARVHRIMRRLAPPYVDFDRQVRVHLVDTDEWNAAAMGNGAIWVYTGLIDSMTDDELSVVLGHELAHYTHEHSRRQAKSDFWRGLAGLGAALALNEIDSDAARAVATVAAGIGLTVWGSGYSRDLEDQADRVGLRYVHEAGYEVSAGPRLWAKFREAYGEADQVSNFFFGSHSRPSDRIRNIQREIAINYPGARPGDGSGERDGDDTVPRTEPRDPEPAVSDDSSGGPSKWERQVEKQLDEVATVLPKGFSPATGRVVDVLEPNVEAEFQLPVEPGKEYVLIGVCDADCSDLDLYVDDSDGYEVGFDDEPDDYPVVEFRPVRRDVLRIVVHMVQCAARDCVFGIEAYARPARQ